MAVGFGLSNLGLGFFMPMLVPAGAVIMIVGVVLVLIDR